MIETMMQLVEAIFGVYTPVTYTDYIYMSGAYQTVEKVAPGLAGVDWPWVAGVWLFVTVLYSFLRILGSVINLSKR